MFLRQATHHVYFRFWSWRRWWWWWWRKFASKHLVYGSGGRFWEVVRAALHIPMDMSIWVVIFIITVIIVILSLSSLLSPSQQHRIIIAIFGIFIISSQQSSMSTLLIMLWAVIKISKHQGTIKVQDFNMGGEWGGSWCTLTKYFPTPNIFLLHCSSPSIWFKDSHSLLD